MSLENELGLELDDFGQQKIYGERDSIVKSILNILFMKPGHIPNLPHIGIDINKYIYAVEGSVDPDQLKVEITSQCRELLPYLSIDSITVKFTDYERMPILLIGIPVTIKGTKELIILGLSPNKGMGSVARTTKIFYHYEQL